MIGRSGQRMDSAASESPTRYTMLYRRDGSEKGYWCSRCFGIDQARAPELRPPFLYTQSELAAMRKRHGVTVPNQR